ncbi:hypothetical protein GCM10010172_55730 [Paractinoplanes ferrugineus]|uniref:Uncharacterized protein n=1 Tax=Paractinoplanes ferrugineus TaxID=113564 RepID=A0A919J5G8_9ACTN|nr:hypothetical protein Afe05nite_27960 [Actinoplanes ferrugineus]
MPDAAVATGTCDIDWKLPLFDGSVGTAAQPEPKLTIESLGADDGIMLGAAVVVVGAAAVVSLLSSLPPQAAMEAEKARAAATAVSLIARIRSNLHLSG